MQTILAALDEGGLCHQPKTEIAMETYLMLGRDGAVNQSRTGGSKSFSAVVRGILKERDGKLVKSYAMIGPADIVLIVQLPADGSSALADVSQVLREETGFYFQSHRLISLTDAGLDSGFPHIHINAPHINSPHINSPHIID